MSFLQSFRTKNILVFHNELCENKDFCDIALSSEGAKILKFNQQCNWNKAPYITYADLEYLIKKIDKCRKKT